MQAHPKINTIRLTAAKINKEKLEKTKIKGKYEKRQIIYIIYHI